MDTIKLNRRDYEKLNQTLIELQDLNTNLENIETTLNENLRDISAQLKWLKK